MSLSIKDYLLLINIHNYLEDELYKKKRDNNGYSNKPIDELEKMVTDLKKVITKLENEE